MHIAQRYTPAIRGRLKISHTLVVACKQGFATAASRHSARALPQCVEERRPCCNTLSSEEQRVIGNLCCAKAVYEYNEGGYF
jgi:hypothetical protein